MTINVTKYRLNPDRIFGGTRGSYGMEKLSFDFGDGWDFDTISVTFHPQRGKPIKVPLLPGVEIDIPAEVMAYSGESRFVVSGRVVGEDGMIERQAITLEGYVDVAYTADEKGGNTRKVTPDMYDQLLGQASKVFNEAREDVEQSATEAEESAKRAEKAVENIGSVSEKADEAIKAAEEAKVSAQNAENAKDTAVTALDLAATAAASAADSAAEAAAHKKSASDFATEARSSESNAAVSANDAKKSAEDAAKNVTDALTEAKNSGEFDGPPGKQGEPGNPGVFIGKESDMPEGTRVRVDPKGKRTKIPQIDETLTKPGYAADAAAVGEKFDQLSGEIADKLDANKLTEAINTALAQAKASGEFDGEPGAPGTTPHIGANGNWWIGNTDTGVKAQGEDGDDYNLTDADKAEIAEEAAKLVEIPGVSEGDFELLEEITINEEGIAEINVDKGYVLSKMLVIVVFPENAPIQTIKVNVLTSSVSVDIALKSTVSLKQHGTAYLECRNGRFFGDTAISIGYETNSNVQHYRAASLLGYTKLNSMKGIKVFPFNTTFTIGTKITVMGVR